MKIISMDELHSEKEQYHSKIKKGEIFIHPTDTIYGLGCNAKDNSAVKKIRDIKERHDMPFSVIAPSKKWIEENCEMNLETEMWLSKLPGPYTLILNLKNKNCVAHETTKGLKTLGVRIPNHWISKYVSELGVPVVTTSANIAGKEYMTTMEELESNIQHGVHFAINEGEKNGRPSTIVDLTSDSISIKKR